MTRVREGARRWLPDASLCVLFLVLGLIGTEPAAGFQPQASQAPDALAYVLVVAAALSLAVRRRPGLCLALNGAVVTAYLAVGYPYGPILLTVPAAVYGVGVRWPLPRAGVAVAADFVVLLVAGFAKRAREPGGADVLEHRIWHTLAWGAVIAAALAVAAAVRVRRESVGKVRVELARRVASEERLRMAQDLHDSIGHGLAVIAMQAGVALHVLDRDPQGARDAMEAVRATSRESLENLRAELEVLRSPGAAARRPAPGLGDLDRLTDRVRAGGVAVRLDIDPDLSAVPPEVSAAAYRILQESLTNVLRHAGAAAARIRVGCEDGTLLVEVTDTGPVDTAEGGPVGPAGARPGANGGGHGIRGIRAQAEALGGTLHAGPRPSGGFAVEACLPLYGGKDR
ncbi:sensor histidine kinase [Actinomadura sp. HBU206391]|uniref:sensor histidine kinase n=1 Tax=Actinomadura sp. HBU206391 TaxID=2731692 RepID=UPI00164FD6E0|nr:sensor histidine kinase [Actinomadura sp. HBU206391]MBC6459375.1 sensor histidine kinase [Actinomadura sp. HBU206391]